MDHDTISAAMAGIRGHINSIATTSAGERHHDILPSIRCEVMRVAVALEHDIGFLVDLDMDVDISLVGSDVSGCVELSVNHLTERGKMFTDAWALALVDTGAVQ